MARISLYAQRSCLTLILSVAILSTANAGHQKKYENELHPDKRTVLHQYLTAAEAASYHAYHPETLVIDVRTRAEANFLGMPEIADYNIPIKFLDTKYAWDDQESAYKLRINPDFVTSVEKVVASREQRKDTPILLICRSGERSATAANLLAEAGFNNVYTIIDGFEGDVARGGTQTGKRIVNGWKNAGLPWNYILAPSNSYESVQE